MLLMVVLAAAISCGGDDTAPANHPDAGDDLHPSSGAGGGGAGDASAGVNGAGQTAVAGQFAGRPADNAKRELPRVYPLVRASTPSGLIGDTMFMAQAFMIQPSRDGGVGVLPQALGGAINLAVAVKERFYSMGPTEVLRIVKDLDGRVAGLDTDPSKHKCLTAAPIDRTIAFPSGQQFAVKLQCLQSFGNPGDPGAGWVAFGFGPSERVGDDDAGVSDADGGVDAAGEAFYLVEGQEHGMGGAYRVVGDDVEAWIAVADSSVPANSQVLMHLITHKTPATSELVLAGSGVGFCSGHMKTSADYIYIEAKTNGAPPPGTPMMAGDQYCDAPRAGCFAVSALETELNAGDEHCRPIAHSSFEVHGVLDASSEAGANVMAAHIYTYLNQRPTGIEAF